MYCTLFQITPKGLRDVITWIKKEYGEEWEILITENGYADEGELNDTVRIDYLAVSIQYTYSYGITNNCHLFTH
jgi:beta-glucosidase/6-phospho-beta-glucosidase/beta-galactosidase